MNDAPRPRPLIRRLTATSTGDTYTAEVLGSDAEHDVAVLRLEDAPTLTEVTTDTEGVSVGDTITAVGDAGGDGGALTAASGTVTDENEPVTVTNDDGSQTTIRNLVEVDADIISGHSGGALLDGDGEVVGMNVAASRGGPRHHRVRHPDRASAGDRRRHRGG